MKDIIELIEWSVKQFTYYFHCFYRITLNPSDRDNYTPIGFSTLIIFLALSATLIVPFEYLILKTQPAVIDTHESWLINLPTTADRSQYTSGNYLLSVFNILEWMYIVCLVLIGHTLMAKIISWRRVKEIGLINVFTSISTVNMVSIVSVSLLGYCIFKAAVTEQIPNQLFMTIFFVLGIMFVYFSFVILIKAYKSILGIGFTKSLTIIFLAELLMAPVLFLGSPVQLYRDAKSPDTGLVRAEQIIHEADLLLAESKYDEAIRLANEALTLSPHNISADFTIIGALLANITESESAENALQQRLVANLDRMSRSYSDLPSVQLFIASNYARSDECTKAKIAYRTVAMHDKALPFEKIRALLALNGLEKTDYSEAIYNHKNTIWIPEKSLWSIITVVIRTTASTQGPIGFELAINDLLSGQGTRFRHSVFPILNEKSDFIDYEIARLCGYIGA